MNHEFPGDYRNGVKWWMCDPSKRVIWFWWRVGENVVRKGEVQMWERRVERVKQGIDWGVRENELMGYELGGGES